MTYKMFNISKTTAAQTKILTAQTSTNGALTTPAICLDLFVGGGSASLSYCAPYVYYLGPSTQSEDSIVFWMFIINIVRAWAPGVQGPIVFYMLIINVIRVQTLEVQGPNFISYVHSYSLFSLP